MNTAWAFLKRATDTEGHMRKTDRAHLCSCESCYLASCQRQTTTHELETSLFCDREWVWRQERRHDTACKKTSEEVFTSTPVKQMSSCVRWCISVYTHTKKTFPVTSSTRYLLSFPPWISMSNFEHKHMVDSDLQSFICNHDPTFETHKWKH